MLFIKILIGFFICLFLAHIFSKLQVIEGVGTADDDKTGDSPKFQEQSSTTKDSEQYSSSQQAGNLSALNKKAEKLDKDISDMTTKLNNINKAVANNSNKACTTSKMDKSTK